MPLKAKLILVLLCLAFFLFVLNLIRKRKLKIEHSILWLFVSAVILMASIWQNLPDKVAELMGVDHPPSLFLAIAILFSFVILMHFSIELSKLKDQNKSLTQEFAIYKNLIEKLEKKSGPIDEGHTFN